MFCHSGLSGNWPNASKRKKTSSQIANQLLRPSGSYQNEQVEIEEFDLRTQ